jgi:hypothetical protein
MDVDLGRLAKHLRCHVGRRDHLLLAWFALPETLPVHERLPISAGGIARTYAGLLRDPAFRTPALVGGLPWRLCFPTSPAR